MAQLAFTAIGGLFGYVIGGPAGMRVGMAVGAYIGATEFGDDLEDQEANKKRDIRIQSSAYGVGIPKIWGVDRVEGNVIWASNVREDVQSQEVGGGKGGGPTGTVTSYNYYVDIAIGICEGPINDIQRCWFGGNLVYDATKGDSPDNNLSAALKASAVTLYYGNETQTADPLIESYEGAGDVPGFRGLAYIVLQNVKLNDYGGSIMTLNPTFEVVRGSNIVTSLVVSNFASASIDTVQAFNGISGDDRDSKGCHNGRISTTGDIYTWSYTQSGGGAFNSFSTNNVVTGGVKDVSASAYSTSYASTGGTYPTAKCAWAYSVDTYCQIFWNGTQDSMFVILPDLSQSEGLSDFTTNRGSRIIGDWNGASNVEPLGFSYCESTTAGYNDGYLYVKFANAGSPTTYQIKCFSILYAGYIQRTDANVVMTLNVDERSSIMCSDSQGWYLREDNSIKIHDHASSTPTSTITTTVLGVDTEPNFFCRITGHPVLSDGFLVQIETNLYHIADNGTETTLSTNLPSNPDSDTRYYGAEGQGLYMAPEDVAGTYTQRWYVFSKTASGSTVTLDEIVEEICDEVNLESGDIDVTDITTPTVYGYKLPQPMTAKGAILPLMKVGYFDLVESDYKIVFKGRNRAASDTITEAKCGVSISNQLSDFAIDENRGQETEIPYKVYVSYTNIGADYDPGQQYSSIQTSNSKLESFVEVAAVLDDDQAKRIADTILWCAQTGRSEYKIVTDTEYLYLDPGDVVTLNGVTCRIIDQSYSFPGVCSFKLVKEDTDNYISTNIGGSSPVPTYNIAPNGPTRIIFMDMPVIDGVDDNTNTIYAVAYSLFSGWSGCVIYVSVDSGLTYSETTTTTQGAIVGIASNALGDYTEGEWDYNNTLTVLLSTDGELSSTTEANVLNGANYAALANGSNWEIIQYKEANLVDTNTYELTGLLRGRRGTENYISGHATSDIFVAFNNNNLLRITSTKDALRYFKAVSEGLTIQDALEYSVTNTGVNIKPFAPYYVQGERDGSNNIDITWIARGRIAYGFNVSLDTDITKYSVDIFTDNTFVTVQRTIETSDASTYTVEYTSAQQTTDFGSIQSTIYVKVYAYHSVFGRGFTRESTLVVA